MPRIVPANAEALADLINIQLPAATIISTTFTNSEIGPTTHLNTGLLAMQAEQPNAHIDINLARKPIAHHLTAAIKKAAQQGRFK